MATSSFNIGDLNSDIAALNSNMSTKTLNTVDQAWKDNLNLNNVSGTLILKVGYGATNGPTGWGYYTLLQIERGNEQKIQIAIGNDNNLMERSFYSPNWNSWVDIVNGSIKNLTTSISISASTASAIVAKQRGNMVFVDIVVNPNSNLSNNETVGTISGVTLTNEVHAGCITPNGSGVRLRITTNGTITVENAVSSGQWIACSLVGMLA